MAVPEVLRPVLKPTWLNDTPPKYLLGEVIVAVRWRADQPDDPPPVQDYIPTMVGFTDEPNVIFGEEKSGENQGLPLEAVGGVDGAHMPESILKHDIPVVVAEETVAVAAPVMRLDTYPQEQPQQDNEEGMMSEALPAAVTEEETQVGWREMLLARVREMFPVNASALAQSDIDQAELAGTVQDENYGRLRWVRVCFDVI